MLSYPFLGRYFFIRVLNIHLFISLIAAPAIIGTKRSNCEHTNFMGHRKAENNTKKNDINEKRITSHIQMPIAIRQ